jgi:IPT/TIG domain-containing protein
MTNEEQLNKDESDQSSNSGPGGQPVNAFGIVLIATYIILVFAMCFYILIKIWPRCVTPVAAGATQQTAAPPAGSAGGTPSGTTGGASGGGTTTGAAPGGAAGAGATTPGTAPGAAAGAGATTAGGRAPGATTSGATGATTSGSTTQGGTTAAPSSGGAATGGAAGGASPGASPTTGAMPAATCAVEEVEFFWRKETYPIWPEVQLLLMVLLTGALGALLHALRSVFWYVGHRDLRLSWLLMYALLPFSGALVGFAFYLVLRGGFFPQAPAEQSSPFGFAALSLMVGLFSAQAVLKLKAVFETLFTQPKPGSDSKPQGSSPGPTPPTGPAPAPTVTGISKTSGKKNDTIDITGSNFAQGVSVKFGEVPAVAVVFVSSSTLKVTVPDSTGTVDIRVTNKDGQSTKAPQQFTFAP